MQPELMNLLAARKGHFLLESGHHGDLWLDLELLCSRPNLVRPYTTDLANRLGRYDVEAICGPLIEGAFAALMVAEQMKTEFVYTERFERPEHKALFPVEYRIPPALREKVRGKRVAIVNDVINAGSAVRSTFADLLKCNATPVTIGALLVLGNSAASFAADTNVALESLEAIPNTIWTPDKCPLCAAHMTLTSPAAR